MTGLDNADRQADLSLQVEALEQDADRLARAHRAQVRLFNENFAQSRSYWLAVWKARQ